MEGGGAESAELQLEDFKLEMEAVMTEVRDQNVADLEVRISERIRELVANTNKLWRAVLSRAVWKVCIRCVLYSKLIFSTVNNYNTVQ